MFVAKEERCVGNDSSVLGRHNHDGDARAGRCTRSPAPRNRPNRRCSANRVDACLNDKISLQM